MPKGDIIKSHCNQCGQDTRHNTIAEKIRTETELVDIGFDNPQWVDLSWRLKDFMLECCGCGDITLKRISIFLETHEEETTYYPPRVSRKKPQWFDKLPKEYDDLLKEIYSSLHANNRFLSAMGARSIIDIFIYRKVGDCGDFKSGLKKLVGLGYITLRNKTVIESAIEVGHAATHRSFRPTENQLNMVMDIVENLIQQDLIEDSATTLKKALPARGVRLQKDNVKKS